MQNEETLLEFRAGLVRLMLWSQPVLWQIEDVQSGVNVLLLWFWIELLYPASTIARVKAVLVFWWQ